MNKFLIQDGNNKYTIQDGVRVKISELAVTPEMFLVNGMDDVAVITSAHLSDLSAPKILLYKV